MTETYEARRAELDGHRALVRAAELAAESEQLQREMIRMLLAENGRKP